MARTANDDRWVFDLLQVHSSDRVLDVGCGPGVTLQLLAQRAHSGVVVGIDPSDVMLRQPDAVTATRWKKAESSRGRPAPELSPVKWCKSGWLDQQP